MEENSFLEMVPFALEEEQPWEISMINLTIYRWNLKVQPMWLYHWYYHVTIPCDYTMWKSTSSAFRICVTQSGLDDLSHSYWLSKSGEIQRKFLLEKRRCKKKTWPQFRFLGPEIESAWDQHGCFNADSILSRNFQNCGRVFFFGHLIIIGTLSLFQPCVDFERW